MVSKDTDVRDKLWMLLVEFAPKFSADSVEMYQDLIRAGEYRVYLEILCDELCDMDAEVSSRTLALIIELASWMKMDTRYWYDLRVKPAE